MQMFVAARRHLKLTMMVKLSHWHQLPWVLFGLAHHCEEKARACASRALCLFADVPDPNLQHRVSVALCAPGSIAHEQMLLFVRGERSLTDLPHLQLWATRFRFTVAARWIESRHALVHKTLARVPRFSPAHLALEGASEHVVNLFRQQSEQLEQSAELCKENTTILKAAATAGVKWHPGVMALVHQE